MKHVPYALTLLMVGSLYQEPAILFAEGRNLLQVCWTLN